MSAGVYAGALAASAFPCALYAAGFGTGEPDKYDAADDGLGEPPVRAGAVANGALGEVGVEATSSADVT